MKRLLVFFLVPLIAVTEAALAEDDFVLLFHADGLNVDQQEIDGLWRFVKGITHTENTVAPPHIHFISFNSARGNNLWTLWQERWRRRMNMESNPPWIMFDGFYYKGTKIIQINPELFLKRSDAPELSSLLRGEGNAIIGHEMLHYIFATKGVPSFLEHCIMDIGGFDAAVSAYVYRDSITRYSTDGDTCEETPQNLVKGGLEQVYSSPLHNPYFK